MLKRIEPARYDYFMSTKLRKILALSDVDILSDLEYMLYKNQVQEDVKHWHKEAKGTDKYLTWKVRYALSIYTAAELLDGVKHISKFLMKYPIENIFEEVLKEDTDTKKGER